MNPGACPAMRDLANCYGDKQRFAIEFELEERIVYPFGHGYFRYWIGGESFGQEEERIILPNVYHDIRYDFYDCGRREGGAFCEMTALEVIGTLYDALFLGNEPGRSRAFDEMWARFEVARAMEALSYAYLIDCPTHSRLLIAQADEYLGPIRLVREQQLRRGEFDAVIRPFYSDLERRWEAIERPP